jgi:hypothetical protein
LGIVIDKKLERRFGESAQQLARDAPGRWRKQQHGVAASKTIGSKVLVMCVVAKGGKNDQ